MIAPDEAYLWHVRPDRLGEVALRSCRGLLADEELERAQAIRRPDARLTYTVARALVRFALSTHGGIPPRAWRFRRGPHGKPEVAAPEEGEALRFSLSHTRGLVACLVGRVDVGVDAEPVGRRVAAMSLARRFFTSTEIRDLEDFPRPYRRQRFLQLWTLKEAYLKARGVGLAGGLDALSIFILGGEPVAPRMESDDPRRWQLGLPDLSDEHVVAYAIRGERIRLHTRPASRAMR